MKETFRGIGFDPDGRGIPFSCEDDHHKLDGLKLESVALGAHLCSQEDVDDMMRFLKIVKMSFPNRPPLSIKITTVKDFRQYPVTPDECFKKSTEK